MIGRQLGHYEILDLLGKGGMGEVYRARDPRLGREVAIKVLPPAIAQNAEVQARFRREATTISSLNHPHICVLHDVGQEGDVSFLVMELVEGLTLDQRLRKGALPLEEVFRYGGQIADALDRAHRAGIIHRDLKPGNVMITRSGAKLMDFGLARVALPEAGQDAGQLTMAVSPTVAHPLTQEGAIVGTYQYMAPEQLEGREVDPCSDLWALGCVLYEMATGTRAFEGPTQASLIGAIMHREPEPVSQRAPVSPPEFDRLVEACLVKDPRERLQSAHDVKLQLGWMSDGAPTSSMSRQAPALPSRRRRGQVRLAAVAIIAALSGAAGMWWAGPRETANAPVLPGRSELGTWDLRPSMTPVITPDGRSVVFVIREGLSTRIYRRDLDAFEAVPIAGTEDGIAPFFSPDGRWLGFISGSAVRKVPAAGGVPQLVAAIANINSADWGTDGKIYLSPNSGGATGDVALYRVDANGGPIETIGHLDVEQNELSAWLPEVLPGASTTLITVVGRQSNIIAFRADGTRHVVVENAFLARYVEPGYLLYRDDASEGTAVVPFDPVTATVTGGAVLLTEPVDSVFCFDVSSTGTLVYVPAPRDGDGRVLTWVDRDGSTQQVLDVQGSWTQPRISPDGRRVLVRKTGTDCELWILDLERFSFSRIVQGDDSHDAIWVPDSRRILFERASAGEIVTLEIVGSRKAEVIASGPNRGKPWSWSGGNDLYAYTVNGAGGQSDIWVRRMNADAEPEPFLASPQTEDEPTISPNGRWIAYTSSETGVPEVYVRPFPDDGSAWQVSAGGGNNALWSRDGSELFFVRVEDASLMAVGVDEDNDELVLGDPQRLFTGLLSVERAGDFDVAADGRFITVSSEGGSSNGKQIRIVSNWPDLVRAMQGEAD